MLGLFRCGPKGGSAEFFSGFILGERTICARTFSPHLWSRDLAACLNMLYIFKTLRTEGAIFDKFHRDAPETDSDTRRRRQQQLTERRIRQRQQ